MTPKKGGYHDDRTSPLDRQRREAQRKLDALHTKTTALTGLLRNHEEFDGLIARLEDLRERCDALPDDHEVTLRSLGIETPSRQERLDDIAARMREIRETIARRERTAEALDLHFDLADRTLSVGKRTYAKQRLSEILEQGVVDQYLPLLMPDDPQSGDEA